MFLTIMEKGFFVYVKNFENKKKTVFFVRPSIDHTDN